MKLNLETISTDPITIQLQDQERIPFKVIVKCESQELALNTYQRPITKEDKLLFEFINNRNLKYLANDIEDFQVQLQQEYDNVQNFEERYEATCKIFLGTQYLKTTNKKRKQENCLNYKTQQIQNQEELLHSRIMQGTQNVAQFSMIGTLRDQNQQLIKKEKPYENKSRKTLVCGIYENENLCQIEDFILSFKNQNVDLVILCNGVDSLDIGVKQKLFMNCDKSTLIKIELSKNQYSVNNALVLQYESNQKELPKVIFIIKYFKSSNYDIQRWLYNGIGKHFDPDYFYVTSCSLISTNNSISTQIDVINKKNLCALTSSIIHNKVCSWNPLNPINTFLLEQTLDQLENITTNKLISVVMDHNPFFCFYNWQKTKEFIDPYLQKIIKSECDYVQNIIVQGVNYILPSLAAEQGLLFGKSENIVGEASCNHQLSKIMNEQRKRKNSKIYTYNQFLNSYSSLSSNWQINFFIRFIQQIALKLMFIHSSLNNYFCISAIIFIFAQSSYDFFGKAFNHYYLYILQLSIPALFLFCTVIFLIFAILFRSQYKIARAKTIKDPILISGNLILHIIHSPLVNSCSYQFEKYTITRNNIQIKFDDIKFLGSSPNQKVMNLFLYQGKNVYCANQFETNNILYDIIQQTKNQQKAKQVRKNGFIEYFAQVECTELCFNYQNQIGEATEQYSKLFYLMAIFNIFFLALFILNIIYNYYFKVGDTYKLIICFCILIVILEKAIKMLLNLSHIQVFIRGYLSYLFYFLMINFGMRFYERINTDNNFENERIKDFYYNKVQSFALWISYNIVFIFICFMIEAYYNFCGYVLLFFLSYYALSSLFSIIFTLISKIFCFHFNNSKKEFNQSQIDTTEFISDQFSLGKVNYENKFLQIKQDANYIFYKQQEQELQYEREQIYQKSQQLQNTLQFRTQNHLPPIQEQSFVQSPDYSTGQIENKNLSLMNSRIKMDIENPENEDSMLYSKMIEQVKQD
ncbi:unnamed protein product [Paramecium pentaurelia]|uniref:Transmembrane protein n=1 Tax=Paramecium pentaurelia TaxID=43138 RepID=A0A8S1UZE0_9CILI|nr:unnamed protein product [Paramecium pentaurelia]